MFSLNYSNQVQAKQRPETVVGGSAANINSTEAAKRLHAVNELRRWMKPG